MKKLRAVVTVNGGRYWAFDIRWTWGRMRGDFCVSWLVPRHILVIERVNEGDDNYVWRVQIPSLRWLFQWKKYRREGDPRWPRLVVKSA